MQLNFDSDSVQDEPREERSNVEDGEYLVVVKESKAFDKGDRAGVRIGFQVLEGRFKNWFISEFITLKSKNPDAVHFGKLKLKWLCEAVGKRKIADSAQLHGLMLRVTVATKGQWQNVVKFEPTSNADFRKDSAPREVLPNVPTIDLDDDDIPF